MRCRIIRSSPVNYSKVCLKWCRLTYPFEETLLLRIGPCVTKSGVQKYFLTRRGNQSLHIWRNLYNLKNGGRCKCNGRKMQEIEASSFKCLLLVADWQSQHAVVFGASIASAACTSRASLISSNSWCTPLLSAHHNTSSIFKHTLIPVLHHYRYSTTCLSPSARSGPLEN